MTLKSVSRTRTVTSFGSNVASRSWAVVSAMGPPGAACADVERFPYRPTPAGAKPCTDGSNQLVQTRSWSFDQSTEGHRGGSLAPLEALGRPRAGSGVTAPVTGAAPPHVLGRGNLVGGATGQWL